MAIAIPNQAHLPQVTPDWDALMAQGALVKLHICRWRAEKARTLDDLGITLTDEDTGAWNDFLDQGDLGAQKLLPVHIIREMRSQENAGRQALRQASIATPWGTFLPLVKMAEWLDQDEKREQKYHGFRKLIITLYPTIRTQATQAYKDAAGGVYRRLNSLPQGSFVPESFREQFAAEKLAHFPGAAELAETIRWERSFAALQSPATLAAERAARARVINDAALADDKRQMLRKLEVQLNSATATASLDIVHTFSASVRREIAQRVIDLCRSGAESLERNEKVPPATITGLRRGVTTMRGLNLTGDPSVEGWLNALSSLLGEVGGDKLDIPKIVSACRLIEQAAAIYARQGG